MYIPVFSGQNSPILRELNINIHTYVLSEALLK